MKRRRDSITRLDAVADQLLRRSAKGEGALLWLAARWDRIVGGTLSRKIAPESLKDESRAGIESGRNRVRQE